MFENLNMRFEEHFIGINQQESFYSSTVTALSSPTKYSLILYRHFPYRSGKYNYLSALCKFLIPYIQPGKTKMSKQTVTMSDK